jgi:hypothetical protein
VDVKNGGHNLSLNVMISRCLWAECNTIATRIEVRPSNELTLPSDSSKTGPEIAALNLHDPKQYSEAKHMFFRATKQPSASDNYVAWILNRVEKFERMQVTATPKPSAMGRTMLSQLQTSLRNNAPHISTSIDNRDGTPRLWLNASTWIQFDEDSESYRFCVMAGREVTMPFHSTREGAMVEWVISYSQAQRELQSNGKPGSVFSQLMANSGITLPAAVAWLLFGALAVAWFFG